MRRLVSPALLLATLILLSACGGSSEQASAAPAKTQEGNTNEASEAPVDSQSAFCSENERRVESTLRSLDELPSTPTELASSLETFHTYLTWLSGELPSDITHHSTFFLTLLSEVSTILEGADSFDEAQLEFHNAVSQISSKYGFTDPEESDQALTEFLSVCGGGFVFELVGDTVEELLFTEEYWLENDLRDRIIDFAAEAPAGFCKDFFEYTAAAMGDLIANSVLDDAEFSVDQALSMFTAIDSIYGWLGEHLPSELTRDAELMREPIAALLDVFADLDPETTTEEELGGALFVAIFSIAADQENVEAYDLANLRIETFLARECDSDGWSEFGDWFQMFDFEDTDSEDFGDSDEEDFYGPPPSDPEPIPDVPVGFCDELLEQKSDLSQEIQPILSEATAADTPSAGAISAIAALFTPYLDWLYQNVPAELQADVELSRQSINELSLAFGNLDPELSDPEELLIALLGLLFSDTIDPEALDLANDRLDRLFQEGCNQANIIENTLDELFEFAE